MRKLIATAAVVLAATALAGCGGKSAAPAPATVTVVQQAAPPSPDEIYNRCFLAGERYTEAGDSSLSDLGDYCMRQAGLR